jgi:NADPH-dependent curcumin reductase
MELVNHQVRLAARPKGLPTPEIWDHTQEVVREPGDGELLVKVLYLSLDPAMRGWMNEVRSYIPPVGIGEVMRAGAIGEVIASRHPDFAIGDHVTGPLGVQEFVLTDGRGLVKVDPALAPLPAYLGALGMTGMTAYFGLLDVGQARQGDTVVISAAAGAVGSVTGQIAKIKDCRVVGIAGGGDKCRFIVDELGFDAAVDYKSQDVKMALRELTHDGVDVYFDNVGGDILDAVLTRLARRARVVICGAISQYNTEGPVRGPANYLSLLVNRARMEGFVVFDYAPRYPEAVKEIAGWMAEGRLVSRETVVEGGLQAFPGTLLELFRGANMGKLVLKVADA